MYEPALDTAILVQHGSQNHIPLFIVTFAAN